MCREANKEPQKSFLLVEMEEKHGDVHYTFTTLTKLRRRELVVPFYPVLLFSLAMDFLLGVFIGCLNYK